MEAGSPAQEERARSPAGIGQGNSARQVTEAYEILGIDHVQVTAPEELVDDMLDFYGGSLGLEQLEKPEGTRPEGGWFRAGAQQIRVAVAPGNPLPRPHFGMKVDDFDAIVAMLREAGSHIEQATPIPGIKRLYTRDPAGNRIEFFSEESRSADEED